MDQMGKKLDNHTVTRGYLEGWKHVGDTGAVGLWYFDIASRQVKYSPSANASFAKVKALYVPRINGRRDDRLENWFASSESQLCDFVRDFRRQSPRNWKPNRVHKALSAIVTLGYRGEYALRRVEHHLEAEMPGIGREEVTIAALNNLYNIAQNRIDYFTSGTALMLDWDAPVLMTNDQPFWDMSPRSVTNPMGVFPLSPTRLMVFMPNEKPASGDLQIMHKKGDQFTVALEFARNGAMRMARKWVVCSSEAEANLVKDYLTEEVLEEVTATDMIRAILTEKDHRFFDDPAPQR